MNMQYYPLVSIVIPVFNGYPYLREAIDSCLGQTYKNIEIIVVNDGSPDDGKTEEIALSYGDKIRYFCKENGGVSSALNFGISHMSGEWFSWLSHDDLYDCEKVQKQVEALQKRKDKECVVRCESSLIDSEGNPIFRPHRLVNGEFSGLKMMKMHYLREVSLYGCSLLIHRNVLKKAGWFDENLRAVQDEMYWWNIMRLDIPFVSIADKLVKIRVHKGQQTRVLSDKFDTERRQMQDTMQALYEAGQIANEQAVALFVYKRCRSGEKQQVQDLRKSIERRSKTKGRFKFMCLIYSVYGRIYCVVKKVYRRIFKKSQQ